MHVQTPYNRRLCAICILRVRLRKILVFRIIKNCSFPELWTPGTFPLRYIHTFILIFLFTFYYGKQLEERPPCSGSPDQNDCIDFWLYLNMQFSESHYQADSVCWNKLRKCTIFLVSIQSACATCYRKKFSCLVNTKNQAFFFIRDKICPKLSREFFFSGVNSFHICFSSTTYT